MTRFGVLGLVCVCVRARAPGRTSHTQLHTLHPSLFLHLNTVWHWTPPGLAPTRPSTHPA